MVQHVLRTGARWYQGLEEMLAWRRAGGEVEVLSYMACSVWASVSPHTKWERIISMTSFPEGL